MENTVYLKPCPFCGSDAEIVTRYRETPKDYYVPSCTNPKCVGRNRHKYYDDVFYATAAWNSRVSQPVEVLSIDLYDAIIESCKELYTDETLAGRLSGLLCKSVTEKLVEKENNE